MNTTVTRMYMSRENRVDEKPLGFTNLKKAGSIINEILEELSNSFDALEEANENYFDAVYDYNEDACDETEAGVQMTALSLEDAWADVQYNLSRYAVLMSIDGNEAFNRKVV